MAFLDKVIGYGDVSSDMEKDYVSEFFFEDEEVIQSYQFIRDQIILTNYGIYEVDVQGLSGKKVEVKFFPKDTIKTISFETAGTLDFDVDIKIGVTKDEILLDYTDLYNYITKDEGRLNVLGECIGNIKSLPDWTDFKVEHVNNDPYRLSISHRK